LRVLLAIALITASGVFVSSCDQKAVSIKCEQPIRGWLKPSDGIGHMATYNKVVVGSDEVIRWNDSPVTESQLVRLMTESGQLVPTPLILLKVSSTAKCDSVDSVRKAMDATPICNLQKRCGEGTGWRNNGMYGGSYGPIEF
jgi:hypothetical protein